MLTSKLYLDRMLKFFGNERGFQSMAFRGTVSGLNCPGRGIG